jgi:hypothetical protein
MKSMVNESQPIIACLKLTRGVGGGFRLAALSAIALLASTGALRAEWGTLSEMHHYRECFGLPAGARPDFKVTMLSSTAPGNVFHAEESPQFTFQMENLGDQPMAVTGRVEVIRYAQPTFGDDQ